MAFIRAGLSQWGIELLDAGEKAVPFGNENWFLTSGNFSYYMGPIARWVLGFTGAVWAFIWAGLSQWVIELLGAAEKAGPFENENWVANVWKLQLLHGPHRPLGFGRYRRGVGICLGGSSPMGY